jgi:hypothetical protein
MQALSNMNIEALRSLLETQFKAVDTEEMGRLTLPQVRNLAGLVDDYCR